jgi:hypothetical protein
MVSFSLGGAAEPAPIELKFNYMYNKIAMPGVACEYFANLINERTKGRVKITTYPAGTLLAPERLYEGVVSGIVDIGHLEELPEDELASPVPVQEGGCRLGLAEVHDGGGTFVPSTATAFLIPYLRRVMTSARPSTIMMASESRTFGPAGIRSGPISLTFSIRRDSRTSSRSTVLSMEADTSREPSGEKATDCTLAMYPARECTRDRLFRLQTWMVGLDDPSGIL